MAAAGRARGLDSGRLVVVCWWSGLPVLSLSSMAGMRVTMLMKMAIVFSNFTKMIK